MKAIRYRFFNAVDGRPMPTVYTALVKPGQMFFDNPQGVELRRIRKRWDGKWSSVSSYSKSTCYHSTTASH